jgi:3-oxoacyl-[acyl-carrier-protein] synthase-3
MGIKIEKPSIYLGSKKQNLSSFAKKYESVVVDKIGSKHIHIENEKNILQMAFSACKKINNFQEISFLIFVSQSQDKILPSCAESLSEKLKLKKNIFVFTISSGCSGFVQALHLANNLLDKNNKMGLIVCAEKYSKFISKKDFKTRVLFSDAASATLVRYSKKNNVLNTDFGYDGLNSNALEVDSRSGKNTLLMDGNKIFLFAINNVPLSIKKVTKNNKILVDKYLVHNGSKFLIDTLSKKIPNSHKKFLTSFHITGNTVSNSIPLLINLHFNKLKKKKIILSGFGVGLSWATLLIEWI